MESGLKKAISEEFLKRALPEITGGKRNAGTRLAESGCICAKSSAAGWEWKSAQNRRKGCIQKLYYFFRSAVILQNCKTSESWSDTCYRRIRLYFCYRTVLKEFEWFKCRKRCGRLRTEEMRQTSCRKYAADFVLHLTFQIRWGTSAERRKEGLD